MLYRIILLFLFLFAFYGVNFANAATCQSTQYDPTTGEKIYLSENSDCDGEAFINTGYDLSNNTWWTTCDDVKISGTALCAAQTGSDGDVSLLPFIDTSENRDNLNTNCWCKMDSPCSGTYYVYLGDSIPGISSEEGCNGGYVPTSSCAFWCQFLWVRGQSKYDNNNDYLYGSFADSDQLSKYKASLFLSEPERKICELGVSTIKTSTGISISLYAEKYTTPSLVVGINGGMCYANMESGNATGALNINYNGTIYHLVD